MRTLLLALLASALLPSPAGAQIVISDSGLFASGDLFLHDVASEVTTDASNGLGALDVAADEAGGVLYLVTYDSAIGNSLYRQPFGAPTPTFVGLINTPGSAKVEGMTFASGRLYITISHSVQLPCRNPVYDFDPASPSATSLVFDPGMTGFFLTGIDFDPSTGLFIVAKNGFLPGVCAVPLEGLYALDVSAQSLTLLATFPAGVAWGSVAVGGGKAWYAGYSPPGQLLAFDLTTLTWDPTPASHPAGTGFGGKLGLTWSPTLAQTTVSGSVSYCTAGTSASGCTAILSTTGTPSASAPSGFVVQASTVEGSKDGLYFFATNGRQANTWGSGTSFQCVLPPVRRAGLLIGVGTPGACDGSFSQDLNALWTLKPAKNPGAGAVVQTQLWYRDPQNTSNQTTSLSDAVEYTVQP